MGMISFQPSFRFNGRADRDPQVTITDVFLTLSDHAWATMVWLGCALWSLRGILALAPIGCKAPSRGTVRFDLMDMVSTRIFMADQVQPNLRWHKFWPPTEFPRQKNTPCPCIIPVSQSQTADCPRQNTSGAGLRRFRGLWQVLPMPKKDVIHLGALMHHGMKIGYSCGAAGQTSQNHQDGGGQPGNHPIMVDTFWWLWALIRTYFGTEFIDIDCTPCVL